jgi:succinate--hydroxymethylglutarate CoA-transferase
MTQRPLHGLKIIDLTRFLAGPYTTMLLGDHGADVLKVEPPEGDPTRVQGPPFSDGEGLTFLATNRNKKSIVLDFKTTGDLALLRKLVCKADVLVENYRPGVLKRFGLDYETLRTVNPRLIYASISGFGSDGPMANQGAFDLTIQALGGYMSITGEPDQAPVKLGTSAFDMLAGMNLYSGILIALLEREKTGLGQFVETSLLESQVAFLANAAVEHLLGFGVPKRWGSEHPQLVPYKAFRSADSYVVIGAGVQNLFESLVTALGRPELLQHPQFVNLAARLENRKTVNETIESMTVQRTTADLVKVLTAAGVPCAPVVAIDEVFRNPQVLHRKMVVQLESGNAGKTVCLGSPVKYSSFEVTDGWAPPPKLSEGGRELAKAWMSETESREGK